MAAAPSDTPLDGQVALVTGASRGIGAHVATHLAACGAAVICAARTAADGDNPNLDGSLATTVGAIKASGGRAVAIEVDLSSESSCRELIEAAATSFGGPVDLLVNNAAVGFFGPTLDLTMKRWRVAWEVTVTAPLLLSQLVLPAMLERGAGRIINLTSESAVGPGRAPYPPDQQPMGDTAYGAQKAAIERLTQGLAEEVFHHGVGVAAIAPSQIVPTPGAVFNRVISGPEDPRAEPPDHLAVAIALLATLPLHEMAGRVVYSQQLLLERGLLAQGAGRGVAADLPISGFAARQVEVAR